MSREPYGDPEVDALIPLVREYAVANLFDGDDGGITTRDISHLCDELAEVFAVFVIDRERGDL